MLTTYHDDSLALHTDLYQINMAKTYWETGMHNRKTVFEVYFRKLPFESGFAVFAGLEKIIGYLQNLRFTESDIEYLKTELGYEDDFLEFLRNLTFTGSVRSMQEGELVFANEPILRVEAPLAEAQLIETAVLNIVNYQTLIATKAARIIQLTGPGKALEFGSRRAQEMDAAIWGARASYIAGFGSTSNVRAGKMFGIPVSGTHSHAMIQAYEDEYTAFCRYAETHQDCVFLVDTYDTLRSGIPNAIRAARTFAGRITFHGIRLDSGDLAYLSKEARRMLDEAGFTDAKIFASNDLDEHTILNLKQQGAKIDVWGIGTKLITAFDQPALGAVYKMVLMEGEDGKMKETIKISSNPEKVTTPGLKKVYRIVNTLNGHSEGDYIAMEDEDPESEEKLRLFHPVHTFLSKFVTDYRAVDLHQDIFLNGKLVYECPDIEDIRSFASSSLELLWPEYLRTVNPEEYPVDLSEKCWNVKRRKVDEVKLAVEEALVPQ